MVANGSPSELMAAVTPSVRFSLDRPLDPTEIAGLGGAVGGSVVALEAGRYRIDGISADPTTISALTEWCATADRRIVELTTVGGSLEDAYLALVGES